MNKLYLTISNLTKMLILFFIFFLGFIIAAVKVGFYLLTGRRQELLDRHKDL